jgi:hypothetical protein
VPSLEGGRPHHQGSPGDVEIPGLFRIERPLSSIVIRAVSYIFLFVFLLITGHVQSYLTVNLSTPRPNEAGVPSTRTQAEGLKVHLGPRIATLVSKPRPPAVKRVNLCGILASFFRGLIPEILFFNFYPSIQHFE